MSGSELVERVEGAEVGSRELDAEIEALFPARNLDEALSRRDVTTSLDAALALAERVLPGWVWNMGNDLPCWAHLWIDDRNYDGNPVQGNSATAALALCAAILRAKECADADECDGPGSTGSGQLSEVW